MKKPEHYKKRLLELRQKFAQQTNRDVEGARSETVDGAHDTADAATADINADTQFTSAELNSTTLQHIDDALQRIEKGTYGKCIVDGGPIEAKRLEAVPWTPYCLKHQSLVEAGGSERSWTL